MSESVRRASLLILFIQFLPAQGGYAQSEPVEENRTNRIGPALSTKTIEYFGLFPALGRDPQNRSFAEIRTRGMDSISILVNTRKGANARQIEIPLSKIDYLVLLDHLDNFESRWRCPGDRVLPNNEEREISLLAEQGVVSVPETGGKQKRLRISRRDGATVSGALLYADSSALYLWISDECYNWRKIEGNVLRLNPEEIVRMEIPRKSAFDRSFVYGMAAGMLVTHARWALTEGDSYKKAGVFYLSLLVGACTGLAAGLVDLLITKEADYDLRNGASAYFEALDSSLMRIMLFQKGYPPEFEELLKRN